MTQLGRLFYACPFPHKGGQVFNEGARDRQPTGENKEQKDDPAKIDTPEK